VLLPEAVNIERRTPPNLPFPERCQPAVSQNNTGMDQKVNQLTKTVESLQKQLGEVTKILNTFNSNKGQDVNLI
jgi:hypothetical protein